MVSSSKSTLPNIPSLMFDRIFEHLVTQSSWCVKLTSTDCYNPPFFFHFVAFLLGLCASILFSYLTSDIVLYTLYPCQKTKRVDSFSSFSLPHLMAVSFLSQTICVHNDMHAHLFSDFLILLAFKLSVITANQLQWLSCLRVYFLT